MPVNSDHIRRDAEHAARSDIRVDIGQIIRRVDEAAKAHIAERLANAKPGELIDGKQLGREAAAAALHAYVIDGDVPAPIDEVARAVLESPPRS